MLDPHTASAAGSADGTTEWPTVAMIDPANLTNFDRSDEELIKLAIFSICVAGKPASRIAPLIDKLLAAVPGRTLYDKVLYIGEPSRTLAICQHFGVAPYKDRVPAFQELARRLSADRDYLRKADADDLATIPGVSMKTSRFFILHSRPDQRLAVLDTHILAWLRELGIPNVPSASPSSRKTYERLERTILMICDATDCTPAKLDLAIWNSRQRRARAADGDAPRLEVPLPTTLLEA